ncbi:MAG: serine hydrolase domain-containing protein [Pseudomonadota bacterium]
MKFSKRSILAVALLAAAAPALLLLSKRETATEAAPALDPAALAEIKPALDEEVREGLRAGFVAGVVTRGGETYTVAAGMADRENNLPMTTLTRFRIASMTKPVITAAIMQLVDRGVLKLSDPVSRFVPAYANARVALSEEPDESGAIPTRAVSRPITIHDLLTHTAGIGYVFDEDSTLDRRYAEANLFNTTGTLSERIELIAKLPLYNDPGKEWRYSYSLDVAGLVIEAATGEPLEAYLEKNLLAPLGMRDTEFFFDNSDFERIAAIYEFTGDHSMQRAGSSWISPDLNEQGFGVISGGAGLVSSVSDYLRFCLMMLRGGELDGVRILSPDAVRLMMSDQLEPGASAGLWEHASSSFGLGGTVVLHPEKAEGLAVAGEWGWTGLWDTWFIVNPTDGVAAVLLAQTQPGPDVPASHAREIVKAAAYKAVAE